MPGSLPNLPSFPILPMRLSCLLENWRVIWRIISNCLSRRLMSTTWVPEPAAMRFFRLLFSREGSSRSAGVMDRMMASVRERAFSSTLAPSRALASTPGSIPAMSAREPMLLICTSWS